MHGWYIEINKNEKPNLWKKECNREQRGIERESISHSIIEQVIRVLVENRANERCQAQRLIQ